MSLNTIKIEKNIPFKEVEYSVPTEHNRHIMRLKYEHDFRKDFLMYLAENERDDLKQAGFWDSLIDRTLAKGKTPPGWGVHHKLPIHGGGENDYDNMIFIRFAEHFRIHRYIDTLIEGMEDGDSRIINMPFPEGLVYIPDDKKVDVSDIAGHEETEEERKARIKHNRKNQKQHYKDRVFSNK